MQVRCGLTSGFARFIAAISAAVVGNPTLRNFRGVCASTWVRLKRRTHPAIGNHEYALPKARGYFDYFDGVGRKQGRAGRRRKGWYSYDLGRWHLISLNANCEHVGGKNSSREVVWLRRRRIDPETGIVRFTVGTGGRSHFQFTHRARNRRRRIPNRFGILRMRLGRGRYHWRFVDRRGGRSDLGVADHDRDPLHLVVRVAPEVPGGLERLHVAGAVPGPAAELVRAGLDLPLPLP